MNLSLMMLEWFAKKWSYAISFVINILLLLLVISVVFYEAYAIFCIFKKNGVPHFISPPQVKNSLTPLQSIATWHLFGIKNNALKMAPQKWILRGIILNKETQNLAIIASTDTDEAIYRSGDKLPDGSTILAIFPEYVSISFYGNIEKLYLIWKDENVLNPAIEMAD